MACALFGCSKGDVANDADFTSCPAWFVRDGGIVWNYIVCQPDAFTLRARAIRDSVAYAQAVATPTATTAPLRPEAPAAVQRDVPDVPGVGTLAAAIDHWCGVYVVSCPLMHSLAQCESGYGTNPRAFDGSSGHWGPFQYNAGTWAGTPPGQRGESANDFWASAEGTAWMLSQGRRGEWAC